MTTNGVNTTQIDGDVSLGRNVAIGGRAEISGSTRISHNLRVDGWLDAPNVKGALKGIYQTLSDLQASYPRPENGWVAGVGGSSPFACYIGKDGEWVATGGTISMEVDMDQYSQAVEDFRDKVNDLQGDVSALEGRVTTAERDIDALESGKANSADVEAALLQKADAADVAAALLQKADASDVNAALDQKANKSEVTVVSDALDALAARFVVLSQAEYDALVASGHVDASTFYYIKEEDE